MAWVDTAINDIKTAKINHNNWRVALSESYSALIASSPGEVVSITGPSRAGKTRLITELSGLLIGSDECIEDGVMPVVKVLATNCSVRGSFSTKAFTTRALQAVKHPFYGVNSNDDAWGVNNYRKIENTTEGVLRQALEYALIKRKTMYFFVDEAQHVLFVQKEARGAAAILDSWKCLAQECGVVLVLVGAYPLLQALKLSPHLLGREQQIHFPRYKVEQEDQIAFGQILESYSRMVRLPKDISSFCNWGDYLYDGTFGCIGLLEKWIRSSLSLVKANGDPFLCKEHFIKSKKSQEYLKQIANEILEGEKILEKELSESGVVENEKIIKRPNKRRKKRAFKKNPHRYEIDDRV